MAATVLQITSEKFVYTKDRLAYQKRVKASQNYYFIVLFFRLHHLLSAVDITDGKEKQTHLAGFD